VVEIKSVIASTQFATVKRQKLDPAYRWQCIGNLKFTGRDWIDYISYCADFPEDKQLFVQRVKKEDCKKEFEMIDARVKDFMMLILDTRQIITESSYSI